MADLTTLQGILALVDAVNFTPQADKLGEKYHAKYTAYFQEKIKTIVEKYNFQVVKAPGDAVLFFGTSPEGLLEIMLDIFERDKPEDKYGFISRFRLVAHCGFFQFLEEKDNLVDLVSPEGIKVFRLEKHAHTWEPVVTHSLFQGLKPLLNRFRMEAHRMVLNEPLKGFDSQEWFQPFYRLRIMPESGGVSNLLGRRLGELEEDVQSIPVFGRIYPSVPMEKNFINLALKWKPGQGRDRDMGGARPPVPGDSDSKLNRRGIQEEKDKWLDHEWSRGSAVEGREIDVPTLYKEHYRGIIIGLPGAGKTTILKHLAFQEFKGSEPDKEKEQRVILLVDCRGIPLYDDWHTRRYGQDTVEPDLESALEYLIWIFLLGVRNHYDVTPEELVEFQKAVKIVGKAFRENRLTLLVDALDEAPDSQSREKIMRLFLLLARETEPEVGNRFFLTSRPSERFHLEQKEIPVFYVLSLTMEQVRVVARNLMEEGSEIYQKFDQAIWQEEMVVKMAATPLTALLVTAYFQAYEKFQHRFPMYDLLVKFILFRVWETIKAGTFPYKNLDLFFQEIKKPGFLEQEREIRILYDALASLCFNLFYDTQDGKIQREMEEELLKAYFNRFIREHLYYEKGIDPIVQADRWLERFHKDHLLHQAGKTRYVFVHSTVMEFLAAHYLVNRILKNPAELVPLVRKCMRSRDHLDLETLPIAAGSDLLRGFAILSGLRDLEVPYDREILHEVAVKCLAELEWQITKTFQVIPLESLLKPMLDLIKQNHNAVDWLYLYLKEMVLTSDKGLLREKIRRYSALLKLSRDTLFKEYLEYDDFDRGDSDLVELRKELLFQLIQKELVEQWLRAHQEEAAAENAWQLDTPLFHPEDKNFRYFQAMIGQELQGFLGSPNMRHLWEVQACAFSPDGKRFISACKDGTLKLWDAATGKEIRTFIGHRSAVWDCAFSPDGNRLVSASVDNTLKLWEVVSGKEIRTLTNHKRPVLSCTFSPQGTHILSTSEDKTIKLWDAETGKEIRTLSGHKNFVRSGAFSPQGKHIISASDDQTLKLWDVGSGKEIRTLSGHSDLVEGCAFSPQGKHIISASDDKTLKLWDAQNGEEIRTLTGHQGRVLNCEFCPGGTRIISASEDNNLKLWDSETGKGIYTMSGHKGPVRGCSFSPQGDQILSVSDDRTLKLWDTASGKEIHILAGHSDYVRSCAFSPNGTQILSASDDNTLKLWDAVNGKEIHTLAGHKNLITDCAFSPDGAYIVSGSYDTTLKMWDVSSGKEIRTLAGHNNYISRCVFSPDGTSILSASHDLTLKLWHASSGKEIHTLKGHNGEVFGCAFSPKGTHLLSASGDQTLKLWNAESDRAIRTFSGHQGSVTSCKFSPQGNVILSASFDGTLKLWDMESGMEIRTMTGHRDCVINCAFFPQGTHILSTSYDKTIKLWDARSGELLKSVDLPWIAYYAAISKDNRVITANQNGTLTLFKFKELE
jgi:WD40 repeat protein